MLDVCLLGTGGMMPLPYRWLTALMTRYNGSNLLIDCGEGTQITMKIQGWSFKDIDQICFTHYHGDHISGLPGLLLTIGNSDRKEPVTLIGPKGLQRVVNGLRVIAPELPFELKFIELEEDYQTIEINGYSIDAFRLNHKILCYGYSLNIHRKAKFDAVKAKELNLPVKYWSQLQSGNTVIYEDKEYKPELVMGESRKGIKVTYCTDTRPVQNMVLGGYKSDLFICEGMYGEPLEETNAISYKHMTFQEAAQVAKEAEVKELWLTHFSPALVYPKEFLHVATKIFKNTKIGKDRKTVTLKFKDDL
jgi:ribonuclease Z